MSSRRPFRGGQRGGRPSLVRHTGVGKRGFSGINKMAGGEGSHSHSQHSGLERLNNDSRRLGFKKLNEILDKEPDAAVVDLNRFSHEFTSLVAQSNIRQDLLILLIQIIGEKFCSKDLNLIEIRNPLLAKVCAIDFLKQLKALTYVLIEEEHSLLNTSKAGDVDKSPFRILKALLSFYHVVWLTMPTLAADHFVGNIEAAKLVTKTIKISVEESDPLNKAFSDLESELTSLKSNVTERLAEQQKSREDGFSRPTRKTAISKGEIERLYMDNPPEDFRTLSVAPQKDELRSEEAPFLRPYIEKGSYPSSDVYLDVQFRLLREDFVQPLREGIQDYMRHRDAYSSRRKKMPFGSVRVYRDVKFVKVKLDGDMTVYSLKFCMDGFKNIKWDKSKRLLTGSLLCLTSDNFQSIYLAIVVFRRLEDLSKGIIDVVWEGHKKPEISQNSSYLMMECEVYYEAYRHTLSAMQLIDLDEYPMKKYIVDANNDDVPPPLYLQQTNHLLNFDSMIIQNTENTCENDERPNIIITNQDSNIIKEENLENISSLNNEIDDNLNSHLEEASSTNNHLRQPKVNVAPLDLRRWPTAAEIGMDESQYSAFQNAITKELSVIQGPPGTGKTYIGLQVAKLFLSNPLIYSSNLTEFPILVVCYTNHALDQFLDGIIDVMHQMHIDPLDNLIRIGSRSKSDNLIQYSIQARMKDARINRKFDSHYAAARGQAYKNLQDCQHTRSDAMDELKGLKNLQGVIDFNELCIKDKLYRVCPPALTTILFGKWKEVDDNYNMNITQKIVSWLGLTRNDFQRDKFNPYALLHKWFQVHGNQNKSKIRVERKEVTQTTVVKNAQEDLADGPDEEEYDMQELMSHRLEIYMEMETVKKREERKLKYALSEDSIHEHCSKIHNRAKQCKRVLQMPYENPSRDQKSFEIHNTSMRNTEFELRRCEEFIRTKEEFWFNVQNFLRVLMNAFHNEALQLPEITPQLLAKAHVMQKGADQATMEERWAIYFHLVQEAKKLVEKSVLLAEETIFAAQKEYQHINTLGEAKILRQAKFVGMTTTGAAKYNTLLRMMQSRIVIVEEAAEVMEAHIVTSITDYCQHLILIGDHKQLRPSTNVYKLAKDYNLDVSLFERLINNNISSCQLRVQHRMRPNICKLLVPTIYKDLENHSSVLDYPRVLGTTKSLFFLSHTEPQLSDDDSATKSNPHEAKFLVKLCRYFILQGYKPEQITVLTTYLGQMFLLKKLNSAEGQTCSGVRITVVDNFQGEENDIIILSLVRSNPNNNIGFLKTDNRICVALSRAKHGMFIMGNMECLIGSGSSTWQKINKDLQNEDNVGTHLELKCEVHGDITLVQNAEDFAKVPEGGCSQMCKRVLSCGDVCQSVCHSWDRNHEKYQCKLPCSKKCENEHECPKECFKDCGNCYVMIDKTLPCGHVVKLECYMPPSKWGCMILVEKQLTCGHTKLLNCKIDPATIKCHEEVEKLLPCGHNQKENCYKKIADIKCNTILQEKMPKCEHEVDIECFKKDRVELWKCYQTCDIQLICGHTCGKICHFENDPNHENHVCTKICRRTCRSDHTCRGNHECRYECPSCDVLTIKPLPCEHQKELKCFVDPDSVLCEEVCGRKLACGHSCLLKCHKDCQCTVKVKRPSINCSHEVESMCFQTPSRDFCEVRVNAPLLSPCGHAVTIPCKIEVTAIPKDYLSYCDHPCEEVLGNSDKDQCGHKCTGNCFKCFQGRIHKRCEKKCGRSLACGHICKSPCAALCPSCKEKCFFKCEHSKCPKQCGFPCVGCNEPCGWACSHARCNKLCREKCDRQSCDKPCTVVLKCGHSCIGLCGEVCPPLCRNCDAEEVQEILFGNEDEEDARFVYLEDCKHAIEVRAMDRHMTTVIVENGVSVKKCPKCNTVMRNSRRYHSIMSEIRKDIVAIKRKIQGVDKKIEDKLWTFVSTLHGYKDDGILQPFYVYLAKHTYTYKTIKKGKSWKSDQMYIKFVDQYAFESLDHMIAWWIEGRKMLSDNNKLRAEDCNVLQIRLENFFDLLIKRSLPLSRREINDFAREFDRISDWFKLYRRWAVENVSTISGVSVKLNQLSSYLTGVNFKIYTSAVQAQFNSQLKFEVFNLLKLNLVKTLDEMIVQQVDTWKAEALNVETRRKVFSAVGFGAQHWHKCPNGHFYVIADCGQPNQASQCPECKCAIGASQYHVLAAGNSRASENDIIAPNSAPSVPDVSFLQNPHSTK